MTREHEILPRFPRRRRWRIVLAILAALAVYLLALSIVPRLFGGERVEERRARALRVLEAPNWGLVTPEERETLVRAVDEAWRSLRSYRMRYVTGLPEDLAAGRFETESESAIRLNSRGHVLAQQDRSYISARSPASGGREERMEGFRIRTDQPYINRKGRRVVETELVYQRIPPGVWVCERVPGDWRPPLPPGLALADSGDAGFAEIDGRRVRGFIVANGAFGLRAPATVWVDTKTLQVRRQEITSSFQGRREVWTYGSFDEPLTITPPEGVPCREV